MVSGSARLSFRRLTHTMRRVKAKFHPHSPPEPQRPPPPSEQPPRPAPDAPPVPVASPISRVPAELLMEIFTHVPRMEFEESLRAHAAGVPLRPTWMSIAQVCRHWRAIVANFKDFWAYIPLQTSAYWAEVSLARSYPHPISFRVDCSTTQPEWYRRVALSALRAVARAQEVHLQSSAATNLEFRMEVLHLLGGSPAPKLETLSINGAMARNLVLLSDDIFLRYHNAVVALRSLTLVYCDVRPSNALFHAPLVSLHLENCEADNLLEVLSRLPHLRTLNLESTPSPDTPLRNLSNIVHLQQLQHLAITNASGIVAFLIKGILTSASTSLSITCTDYTVIDEPLDDTVLLHIITSTLSAVLSAHLERALGAGYSFPLLEITTPSSAYIRTLTLRNPASEPPGTSLARPIPGVPQLQLSLGWGDASDDLFSALLSALPAAALRRVHMLGMRDDPPRPSLRAADGRSRPQPFAESHEKARDEAVRGLLAIVAMHGVLPALRGVSLEGIDLDNTDVDSLVRVLLARRRRGEPVRLALRDCLASKGTIQALRNYLGSGVVDWG
ncbi:hypothetical protein EDB83DRAFT_241239 [Lactarius deliciosus]|nr:hypothetical protein EDB83DRAFT_241239 [Lactarius deliciosus]